MNASNVHINLSQGTVDCPNLSSVGILVDNQQNVHINASLTGTVKNCAIGIHLTGGGGIHHINGVILRSNSTGISLGQQSNKNHINGNDSSSNGFHGILVATDKNHINGNTTNDNGSQGIVAVGSSTNNHINGNTAFGNGFATTPANGADLADTTNCDTNRWNSNDFGTKREECIS